jgi:hypothetical protein
VPFKINPDELEESLLSQTQSSIVVAPTCAVVVPDSVSSQDSQAAIEYSLLYSPIKQDKHELDSASKLIPGPHWHSPLSGSTSYVDLQTQTLDELAPVMPLVSAFVSAQASHDSRLKLDLYMPSEQTEQT